MNSFLNKILIFLSVLILLIGIFIASFFIPVYADGVTFTNQPLRVSNTPTTSDLSWGFTFNGITYSYNFTSSSLDNCYIFGAPDYSDTQYHTYYFVVPSNSSLTISIYTRSQDGSIFESNYGSSYNSTYSLCYSKGSYRYKGDDYFSTIPEFSSLEDGLSALRTYLDTPITYDALYDGLSIPRGYLALIEFNDNIPQGGSVSFYSTFNSMSNLFTGTWKNTSQWSNYYNINSIPTISNIISSGGTQISWSTTGDGNILGQSKRGYFTTNSIGAYNVYCICNPVYTDSSVNLTSLNYDYNGELNAPITISDPNGYIKKVRLYALSSSLDRTTGDISNSLADNAQSYNVQGSTTGAFTYEVIGTSSTAISPAENGGTYVDPQNYSTSDIIGTVNNAFSNLINRLETIFHPAASYFNTLIGSASSFVSWMAQLWSWLPSPIVSLIESVLYVSILVGCIKLLF